MMTEDEIELGRRAVASKHWRWLPGMLHMDMDDVMGCRVVGACEQGFTLWQGQGYGARGCTMHVSSIDELPDLTDAATLGCLLALVREAWGEPTAFVRYDGVRGDFCVATGIGDRVLGRHVDSSEAAALVWALEAAP